MIDELRYRLWLRLNFGRDDFGGWQLFRLHLVPLKGYVGRAQDRRTYLELMFRPSFSVKLGSYLLLNDTV